MSTSPNRAILLASAPISGIASAEITRGSGNAQYNVSDGSGNVTDGGVIFQGEADIQFRNNTTDQVIPAAALRRNDQVGEPVVRPYRFLFLKISQQERTPPRIVTSASLLHHRQSRHLMSITMMVKMLVVGH
jgi:hypothetical protein